MKFAGQIVIAVLILVLTHFVLMAQVTTITEADQFKAQCEADFQQANSLFEKLEKSTGPQTIETVLVPLNDLWLAMDRSGNLAAIYQQAHPDAQIREIAEDYDQKFSKLELKFSFLVRSMMQLRPWS